MMLRVANFLIFISLIFAGCDSSDQERPDAQSQSIKAEQIQNKPAIIVQKGEAPKDESRFISYDIHGQKKIDFGIDKNEISRAIGALVMVRNPYEKINLDLLKGSLSKNFILKCSACHDDYANGIIGPSLLQKTKDEIYTMIESYRRKEKVNILMRDLVMQMDDKEIMELAREIDEFNEQFRSKK